MGQNQHNALQTGPDALILKSSPPITILERHIETLTDLVLARFPSEDAESARIADIRTLLGAAYDLRRAQDRHTHYVLVDHRGTRGSNDLKTAGQQLFSALQTYALALRDVADRYRDFSVSPGQVPHATDDLPLSLEAASRRVRDAS